ncbi:MAG TPA: M23 family metallopeptidase, partial [Kofleriaceae bacterium]|nr:M23 family metallopeptidase [Kofleriaceae bacterium]
MSRVPWLVGLGGSAAALYFWSRQRDARSDPTLPRDATRASSTTAPQSSRPFPPQRTIAPAPLKLEGRWVWPVASWQGRPPTISDGFNSPRAGYARHGGVDLMFARTAADTALKPGTPNASKGSGYVMPDGVHALAASEGVVWSAMQTPQGYAVVIDHGKRGGYPVATFYTHLDKLLVQPTARGATKERVSAGQPLGTIGFSPLDGEKLKHLHFEVWLGGPKDRIDPAAVMRGWQVAPSPAPVLVARNAGATFR